MAILYFKIISYCDKWLLCVCLCVCVRSQQCYNKLKALYYDSFHPSCHQGHRAAHPRAEEGARRDLRAQLPDGRPVPLPLRGRRPLHPATVVTNLCQRISAGEWRGKVFVGVSSSGRPKLVLVRFQFRNFGFLQFRCFGRNTYFGQNSLFWPK